MSLPAGESLARYWPQPARCRPSPAHSKQKGAPLSRPAAALSFTLLLETGAGAAHGRSGCWHKRAHVLGHPCCLPSPCTPPLLPALPVHPPLLPALLVLRTHLVLRVIKVCHALGLFDPGVPHLRAEARGGQSQVTKTARTPRAQVTLQQTHAATCVCAPSSPPDPSKCSPRSPGAPASRSQ